MELPPDEVPQHIWRLSKHASLDGFGGINTPGRWHTPPQLVVYCSDAPYTAYREILHHLGGNAFLFPDELKLLKIRIPQNVSVEVINHDLLDPSWCSLGPAGWPECQAAGMRWFASHPTALLRVPSVALMGAHNFLINPTHFQANGLTIEAVFEQPFAPWLSNPALLPA